MLSKTISSSTSMLATWLLEILLLTFQLVLSTSFHANFSPFMQTGQDGSNLSVSRVIISKQFAWKTCPQTRTATTELVPGCSTKIYHSIPLSILHTSVNQNKGQLVKAECSNLQVGWCCNSSILYQIPCLSMGKEHEFRDQLKA